MTALSTAPTQTPLAKLIDEREALAASAANLRKLLRQTPSTDLKARQAEQTQARVTLGLRVDGLRTEAANVAYAERERAQLLAMATCNEVRNMLAAEKGHYGAEARLARLFENIDTIERQLAQPDPELVDARIELTNSLAICEQRLAVVKTQIQVLIP